MNTASINKRYSILAESDCCLSCGGAIDYSSARQGEICVDLGSGRGTDAMRLAEAVGEKGFVYGIDTSDGMLNAARMNASKLGVSNVAFIQCDLEDLALPSEIADLVISNCTINHAGDKQKVWKEIFRIMKTGGRLVVSDIYALEPVPGNYRTDPVAVSECWAGAVTREEYLSTLSETGFTDINIIEESNSYDKGRIKVASFTIFARKASKCCCGK